ncbi:hypothetical protein SVI_1352 [Shewanella violacea DSS12]|uniref:Uncharacterized protein n=1 Tax=Shewanella violacea (strain JCM 10179 / CIP 106290 / LMG 19151 / DSS12) TaxID=637905 RepID=D4ZI24_SHEVD|nr:hypothetical protein SVI_1352 [Shewanella violacea DSS12]
MHYQVHCRTGSLEIRGFNNASNEHVHCRTGSLEIYGIELGLNIVVHCRTGNLENLVVFTPNMLKVR